MCIHELFLPGTKKIKVEDYLTYVFYYIIWQYLQYYIDDFFLIKKKMIKSQFQGKFLYHILNTYIYKYICVWGIKYHNITYFNDNIMSWT